MTFYYIMKDPDKNNGCKLGITKNPPQRLKAYRTAAPACYYYMLYKIPNKIHERRILDLLKDIVPVNREYVYGNIIIIQNIIEGYFDDNDIMY